MEKFDAIIIGAGPAGLMVAREFTKNNIKYLIIESKDRIGHPLRCGEVTREETFLELFNHTNYSFITNRISNVSFQVNKTQKIMKKNFLMLDKPKFLEWLSAPIKDNLHLNTICENISKKKNFVEVITNKDIFQAKLVILANGTNYKIQREFGLLKREVELIPCVGGLFKNDTLNQNTAYFFYDEDMFIASWVFPKGKNIVNAGAGIILKNKRIKRQNLKGAFKELMKNFSIPLEGEPSFGGSYVTNGPINKTYCDHVLICGDSAGQVFAGIGEGIYFSLKAGQIAANTAIESIKYNNFTSKFLERYEIMWKKSFGRQMDAGAIFVTILFFLMRHNLTRNALKIIKPKEIHDVWIKGEVSFRIKLFHMLLRLLGFSPKR